MDRSKQCRPRLGAAERGVWSGSTLLGIHPAIFCTYQEAVKFTTTDFRTTMVRSYIVTIFRVNTYFVLYFWYLISMSLNITTLWANSADDKLVIYFIISHKTGFEISYWETICMKCQILVFLGENKKNISKFGLLKFLPRVLSVDIKLAR